LESKKQKAQLIQKLLDEIIPNPAVPLNYANDFQLLVATLLSAQCTDVRVNLVTGQLFQVCPTPYEMAKMPLEKLTSMIASCGLANRKALSLLEIAKILIERFGGKVPSSFEELESLPGVGHKTASCVIAHAFHRPAFPVDTHIFRVARRWGLSSGKTVETVEADLKRLYPKSSWSKLHLQMILYARRFCPAKRHIVDSCPICRTLRT
jgi:endonuclease III